MMIRLRRALRHENGFTLSEVLIALTIFMIVSIGVMPLFITAIRGSAVSRTYTVGKNIVVEATERVRGLPYYVDFPTQRQYSGGLPPYRMVDVLDLYFPNLDTASPTGYEASLPWTSTDNGYVTVCSGPGDPRPACPKKIPTGYTVTFIARFVEPVVDGSGEERYSVIDPAVLTPGYRWDDATLDVPPSQIVELTIRGDWSYQGRGRNFKVVTLVGNREFGEITVKGIARAAHAVRVQTHYVDSAGGINDLTADAGFAESTIETKTATTAVQNVRAAHLTLTDPSLENPVIAEIMGADASIHAAPDTAPTLPPVGGDTIVHLEYNDIAGIGTTSTNSLKAQVAGDLPNADGAFAFAGDANDFWVTNVVSTDPAEDLHLVPSPGLVNVVGATGRATSLTIAKSSPARSVQTTVTLNIPTIRVFPISTNIVEDDDTVITNERAVILIKDFQATVDCKSTPNAGAYATYNWSANLKYLKDKLNGDGNLLAKYVKVPVGSSLSAPSIDNVLVYEGGSPANDIWLFEEADKRGYLSNLTVEGAGSPALMSGQNAETGARVAGIDSAISIATSPTHPGIPDTSTQVSVGKLSCEALDVR
jgi:type II secretory pathway pseudopilin PulG